MKINILLTEKNFTMIFINFAIMAKKQKKQKRHTSADQPQIIVDPALSSFEGHPFFEKKAADSKALLDKVGLPKQLPQKPRP
jgi:hypothetical protein